MRVYQTIAPQYSDSQYQYHFTIINSLENNPTLQGTLSENFRMAWWHVCYRGCEVNKNEEMLVYENLSE